MGKIRHGNKKNIILFLSAIFVLTFLFSACSKKEKKGNGLVVINGLIYKKDSKVPYTGKEIGYTHGIKVQYDVVKGVKTGEFKTFYPNGAPQMAGNLINNKNEGLWKYYYPDSSLESQGNFKDDLPEGKWEWYYKDGKLKEIGYYAMGKREGKWQDYNEKGKVIFEKIYKDGKEIKKKSDKKKR